MSNTWLAFTGGYILGCVTLTLAYWWMNHND